MKVFQSCDMLLPKKDFKEWAVVACDQFTSQPEYWEQVREIAKDKPSTCKMFVPEAELKENNDERIAAVHEQMREYRREDIYQCYPDSYIYVEREQSDKTVRRSIVGCIDLEEYDFHKESKAYIKASEETVMNRIPPRIGVREGAATELSHVILYVDDDAKLLVEPVCEEKEKNKVLYDFDLMQKGGHIKGWLLGVEQKEKFEKALEQYYAGQEKKAQEIGKSPVYFMIGDGNHSLATAKACYEKLKKEYRIDSSCYEER